MQPGKPEHDVNQDLAPASDRLRIIALVVSGAVFVGLLVLVLILRERGEDRAGEEVEVPLEVRASNDYVALLRESLSESPCDRKTIVELATELNKARRFEDTVAETTGFIERCGPYPYLLWKTYYAHEQLSQWAQAADVASALIEEDARDSDYWWWRAKARARAGELARAVADYRQSIANSNLVRSNGAHVIGLADLAEEAGVECEAVAALRFYMDFKDGEVSSRVTDRIQKLALSDRCRSQKAASGAATIALDPDAVMSTVSVRLGGRMAEFAVDQKSGLTLIGAPLAAELGLSPTGLEVQSMALGRVRSGRVAVVGSIEVSSAIAPRVDVLVVDDLPTGIEGVVGLSFLWRFAYAEWPEKIALVAR